MFYIVLLYILLLWLFFRDICNLIFVPNSFNGYEYMNKYLQCTFLLRCHFKYMITVQFINFNQNICGCIDMGACALYSVVITEYFIHLTI